MHRKDKKIPRLYVYRGQILRYPHEIVVVKST